MSPTPTSPLSNPEPAAMTEATRQRLLAVAQKLQGKELFPEKIKRAKQALQGLKSLPI